MFYVSHKVFFMAGFLLQSKYLSMTLKISFSLLFIVVSITSLQSCLKFASKKVFINSNKIYVKF